MCAWLTHLKKTEASSMGSSKPMLPQIWFPKSRIVATTKMKFEKQASELFHFSVLLHPVFLSNLKINAPRVEY